MTVMSRAYIGVHIPAFLPVLVFDVSSTYQEPMYDVS